MCYCPSAVAQQAVSFARGGNFVLKKFVASVELFNTFLHITRTDAVPKQWTGGTVAATNNSIHI